MGNIPSKRKKLRLSRTKQAISAPPDDFLGAGIRSMFTNAQNNHFTGNTFNIISNVKPSNEPSLDVLFKRVAPNAILNTGGRADEVRCLPGTREEVIDRIEKWGGALDPSTAPIFWLSGPAGAGKSAIMQTIAERCEERGLPHANFFFFRADASRSEVPPLIPTLLHQIVLLYPSLREPVANLLSANPLIFDSTLEGQLMQLILVPLQSAPETLSRHPLILLIDGLDECDSESKRGQQQILRAFDKVLAQSPPALNCPFRLLVASRSEPHIQSAFNAISSECVHLYLNSQYYPEKDIRIFVNAQFEDIMKTHPLAKTLGETWPSAEDVDYIVDKSSGHFMYAATVMRFISNPPTSPKLSLERVKGAARLATKSPFSHLDAIYTYILAQVEDQKTVKDILHAQLLLTRLIAMGNRIFRHIPDLRDMPLLEFLRLHDPSYTEEIILSCTSQLTPLIRYQTDEYLPLFHHASFSDYLLDESRSGNYFVDVTAFNCKISPMVWEVIQHKDDLETYWEEIGILSLLELETFPAGILNALALSKSIGRHITLQPNPPIFDIIHKQCITDNDFDNFKYIIWQWIDSLNIGQLEADRFKDIPFAGRYFQMARADLFHPPDNEMVVAICPATDIDRYEMTVWLNSLLHAIHEELYSQDIEHYNKLLGAWLAWAKENDIRCNDFADLPDTHKYI